MSEILERFLSIFLSLIIIIAFLPVIMPYWSEIRNEVQQNQEIQISKQRDIHFLRENLNKSKKEQIDNNSHHFFSFPGKISVFVSKKESMHFLFLRFSHKNKINYEKIKIELFLNVFINDSYTEYYYFQFENNSRFLFFY